MILERLDIQPEVHRVIAVVGGGGKTSLIYALAKELVEDHKNVIITTTTHMLQPKSHFLPVFDARCISQEIEAYHMAVVGSPCDSGKIKSLDPFRYEELKGLCDVLLIEADGAHCKPMKVPQAYEPVIPECTDLVIGILGASAIGQSLEEACHRYELAMELLQVDEKHKITVEDLEYLLLSEKGQKKGVPKAYRPVIGQSDYLSETICVNESIVTISLKEYIQKESKREENEFV